jgi:hypothetical protein
MSVTVCYVFSALQIICIIFSSVFHYVKVYCPVINVVSVIRVHSLACELWVDMAKQVCVVQYDVCGGTLLA